MWPLIFFLLPLYLQGQETCETGQCDQEENMYVEELGNRPAGIEDIDRMLTELVKQMFAVADEDIDGVLDIEETDDLSKGFEASYPDMKLGILDENGDGFVTLEEVQESVRKAFFPALFRQIQEQKGSFIDDELVPPPSEEPIINRDGVVIRW